MARSSSPAGAKGDIVKHTHPQVLAVTGPHATDE
jgi:hypothetical protein